MVTSSAVVGSSAIEQARPADQRHCDHRALAHASAELMRICAGATIRLGDADLSQHVHGAGNCGLRRDAFMQSHGLGDLLADAEHRVQRGHRILVDHRHRAAAQLTQPRLRRVGDVLAIETDMAADDARGW